MAKASSSSLEALHEMLAQHMSNALGDPEKCSASLMNVVRQFLKDNGIDSPAGSDDNINNLARRLKELDEAEEQTIQ